MSLYSAGWAAEQKLKLELRELGTATEDARHTPYSPGQGLPPDINISPLPPPWAEPGGGEIFPLNPIFSETVRASAKILSGFSGARQALQARSNSWGPGATPGGSGPPNQKFGFLDLDIEPAVRIFSFAAYG
jgi:hypothetical protein